MARKKLSRDQKRKKKLAQRQKKVGHAVTPYEGGKYRNDKFVEVVFEAEVAIHEIDRVTQEALTDQQVKHSLEYLVRQLRGEMPPLPPGNPVMGEAEGEGEDLVTHRIRTNWEDLLPKLGFHPSNSDLAGVLRTILDSLNTRTQMTPGGRGYLDFLPGFLGQMGVETEVYEDDEEGLGEGGELYDIGEAWVVDGDVGARKEFLTMARQYIQDGDADVVDEVINALMPLARDHHLRESLAMVRQELRGTSWRMGGASPE